MLKRLYIPLVFLTFALGIQAQDEWPDWPAGSDSTNWHLSDARLSNVSYPETDIVNGESSTTFHLPAVDNTTVTAELRLMRTLPKDSTNSISAQDSLSYELFKDGIKVSDGSIVTEGTVSSSPNSRTRDVKWGEKDTIVVDTIITITVHLSLPQEAGVYTFKLKRGEKGEFVTAVGEVKMWSFPTITYPTNTDVSLYEGKEVTIGVESSDYDDDVLKFSWNDDEKSTTREIKVTAQHTKDNKSEKDEKKYTLTCVFGHGEKVWDETVIPFTLNTYPTPKFAYEVKVNDNIIPNPTATIYLLPSDEVVMTGTRTEGAGELLYQWTESGTSAGTNSTVSFTAQNDGAYDISKTYKVTITDQIPDDQTQDSSPEYKFVIYPAPTASFNEKTSATLYRLEGDQESPLDELRVSEKCASADVKWETTWTRGTTAIDENKDKMIYTIPKNDLQQAGTSTYSVIVQCIGKTEGFNKDKVYYTSPTFSFVTNVLEIPTFEAAPQEGEQGMATFLGQNIIYNINPQQGDQQGWTYSVSDNAEIVGRNPDHLEIAFKNPNGQEQDLVITWTNTIQSSDVMGISSKTGTETLKITVYPEPTLAWQTKPLDNYFYGSKVRWAVQKSGGLPDGWTYKWLLDSQDIDVAESISNFEGLYTIPETASKNSDTHEIKCIATNTYKGKKWKEIPLSVQFTAWKPGQLNGIILVSADGTDIYEGTSFQLKADVSGGFDNGWVYEWSRVDDKRSFGSDKNIDVTGQSLSKADSEAQTFKLRVKNDIPGVYADENLDDYKTTTFTVWRKAENIGSDFTIIDQNTGASAEKGIREGNGLFLSTAVAQYGYNNNWHYLWNGTDLTVNTLTDVAPSISGESMTTETKTYTLRISNFGPNGTPWEQTNEMKKTITVYKKPKTPTSLVKKGNGASRTLIATTALSDTQLEDNEYYLVFAYNDNGNIKVISEQRQDNPGQVRWAMQVPADQYANENQLCIYALWVYPDGSRVTSGLLSFDGNADNAWDGSDYSHSTRGGDETGIQDLSMQRDSQGNLQESYTLTGMKSSHLVKGINIVRMNDGSIRKVYKK